MEGAIEDRPGIEDVAGPVVANPGHDELPGVSAGRAAGVERCGQRAPLARDRCRREWLALPGVESRDRRDVDVPGFDAEVAQPGEGRVSVQLPLVHVAGATW